MLIKSSRLKNLCVGLIIAVAGLASLRGHAADADKADFVILAMGDSLMAGYNLPQGWSVPARLEKRLRQAGMDVKVINAGVSGDTSTGGRSRLAWTLSDFQSRPPNLVILEFGGNDLLRGIEPRITRANLQAMIEYLKRQQIPVLLAGMQAPPNMGREYKQEFDAIYPDLAAEYDVALYPFFLEGVAANAELNLGDGIHPNEEGVDTIVRQLAPMVEGLLSD